MTYPRVASVKASVSTTAAQRFFKYSIRVCKELYGTDIRPMEDPQSPTIASSLIHGSRSDIEQQSKVKLPLDSQQGSGAADEQQEETITTKCYNALARGWLVADGVLASLFGIDKSRYDWELHQHHHEEAEKAMQENASQEPPSARALCREMVEFPVAPQSAVMPSKSSDIVSGVQSNRAQATSNQTDWHPGLGKNPH
ncbi:hypothetical protein WJX74_001086 [Apatococcus lobatus]|uniref:Uncharacterized protein n=2 Tax=Apatococcus TaxID=904362 RepID=A0AAW1T6M8_9CHLO